MRRIDRLLQAGRGTSAWPRSLASTRTHNGTDTAFISPAKASTPGRFCTTLASGATRARSATRHTARTASASSGETRGSDGLDALADWHDSLCGRLLGPARRVHSRSDRRAAFRAVLRGAPHPQLAVGSPPPITVGQQRRPLAKEQHIGIRSVRSATRSLPKESRSRACLRWQTSREIWFLWLSVCRSAAVEGAQRGPDGIGERWHENEQIHPPRSGNRLRHSGSGSEISIRG